MKAIYSTETQVLNWLEDQYQTIFAPVEIARRMFGVSLSTNDKRYRSVVRALNGLHKKNHVGKHSSRGSNQSVYWLRSRIVVPPNVDTIPF